MNPKISILLPTRARPVGLRKAVATLYALAAEPAELELLVAYDDDDKLTQQVVVDAGWRETKGVSLFSGPRLGYGAMHEYYGMLASHAKGDLLFVWNDDTEMITKHWDKLLLDGAAAEPFVQFIRRDIMEHADTTFPVIDRRIYNCLGYLAQHCYVDQWLGDITIASGTCLYRNDIVFHHHRLIDQTEADNRAACAGASGEESHRKWVALLGEREADIEKLRKLRGH